MRHYATLGQALTAREQSPEKLELVQYDDSPLFTLMTPQEFFDSADSEEPEP